MTSKYEDALNKAVFLKEFEKQANDGEKWDALTSGICTWFLDNSDMLIEALRKAEAMDRLIEARKGTSNGEWYRVGQPWNNASPYIISGHHDPHVGKAIIDVIDQDEFTGEDDTDLERQEQEYEAEQIINCDFICLAANETAKFIEE